MGNGKAGAGQSEELLNDISLIDMFIYLRTIIT